MSPPPNTTHRLRRPPQTVPLLLEPYLIDALIPADEMNLIDNERKQRSRTQEAEHAFREWAQKRSQGKKRVEGNYIIWEVPDETVKEAIRNHPLTALKCYLQDPAWWSPNEMQAIAQQDPETAYWYAKKATPPNLLALQLVIGQKRPDLLYHFAKEVPAANLQLALELLKFRPYWKLQLNHSWDNADSRSEIEALVPFNCEAASYYIFSNLHAATNQDLMEVALATLALYPEWAYQTALRLPTEPEKDWRWNQLEQICDRSPKWAYHWARDVRPDAPTKKVEQCWNHPGWTAELLDLIAQHEGPSELERVAGLVLKRNEAVFQSCNGWHLAFLAWWLAKQHKSSTEPV
jgi:hypothetical protein